MSKKTLELLTYLVLTSVVTLGASSPVAAFEVMPQLKQVEVACVNISGLPDFTEESCAQLATNVSRGLHEFSDLTDGLVSPPEQVRPRLIAGAAEIHDVIAARCIDYAAASATERQPLNDVIKAATELALAQVTVDPSRTGVVVALNGPLSLCRPEPPKNLTARCANTEARKGYLIGRTLDEITRRPAFVVFAAPDEPERELYITHHERGHLGIGTARLGHDLGLCSRTSDTLPTQIGREEPSLDVDIRAWPTSIMGYSAVSPFPYIASPHLAHLGVIKPDRIITPEVSGTTTLSDPRQSGPAIAQLALTNPALKKAIATEVAKSKLSVDDYGLWIGKIPGLAEIGVYAAPRLDQLRYADIFLLQRLGVGDQLDIVDGPLIKVTGGGKDTVEVDLRLAGSH